MAIRSHLLRAAIAVFCLINVSAAQTGKNSDLWSWSPRRAQHSAIVRVYAAKGLGSGVIYRWKKQLYLATAAHLANSKDDPALFVLGSGGKFLLRDGFQWRDEEQDIMVAEIPELPRPDKMTPLELGEIGTTRGEIFEVCGWGGSSKKLRTFWAPNTVATDGDLVVLNSTVIPGDSGGGILNQRGELVGLVMGGSYWGHSSHSVKIENTDRNINVTFPVRGVSARHLKEIVKRPKKIQNSVAKKD